AVVHVITNRGTAVAHGPWVDFLHVSTDAAIGDDNYLGSVTVTNDLAAGASLSVTQSVVIPIDGDAGNLRFVATVDGQRTVVEHTDDNNVAVSDAVTAVPLTLTLSANAATVPENSTPLTFTVQRNGSRAA